MKQNGNTSIFLLILLLPLLAFFSWRYSVPSSEIAQIPICRPDYINANGAIKSDSPEIMAPDYTHDKNNKSEFFPKLGTELKPYRLIKSKAVLMSQHVRNWFNKAELRSGSIDDLKCVSGNLDSDPNKPYYHNHFCQWVHQVIKPTNNINGAFGYGVQYPASYTREPGYSSEFLSELPNPNKRIFFADYKIIFLPHLNESGDLVEFDGKYKEEPTKYAFVDVYQQVKASGSTEPVVRLPDEVLRCKDNNQNLGQVDTAQTGSQSGDKKQLQLGSFVPIKLDVEFDWYYPSCKPAIYLYPTEKTTVSVAVNPKGYLTYTDPQYSFGGWRVTAFPDGKILEGSREFEYLYYESKIRDEVIKKPTRGYVVSSKDLPRLYSELLPKLGLNAKQTSDFKEYWERSLPQAPYYFVGVMPQEDIELIEPLTITPKPDTMIRVRLYFEVLDQSKTVEEPELKSLPAGRQGFTVVEWGGMVKVDKDHPFTCSQ